MDWKSMKSHLQQWFGKYKYMLAVLLLGLVLMNLSPSKETQPQTEAKITEPEQSMAEELEQILSQMDGVGRVEVMIMEECGAETVYQTDLEETSGSDTQNRREKTVMHSSGGNEEGLIRMIRPASYRGAIIVCEGGGNPAVDLAVVQAVSKLTGIGTDRIAVLKMK